LFVKVKGKGHPRTDHEGPEGEQIQKNLPKMDPYIPETWTNGK